MTIRCRARRFGAAFAAMLLVSAAAAQSQVRTGVGSVELFDLADRARDDGRNQDAESIYRALARDPDAEVSIEARFRLGLLLSSLGRHRDAALLFRGILDEKPAAARVR